MKQVLEPSEHVKSTHLKSSLDIALEQAVDRAAEFLRLNNEAMEKGEDVTSDLFRFRVIEIAKLNNMSALQDRLNAYRERSAQKPTLKKIEEAKDKSIIGDSGKLSKNLTAAGQFKPGPNWEAHHIVCSKHTNHTANRYILFTARIDPRAPCSANNRHFSDNMRYGINDPDNGCWLPDYHYNALNTQYPRAVGHKYIHTARYANWINQELSLARNLQAVQTQLNQIRQKLQSFSPELSKALLTKNGQADFKKNTKQ